LGNWVPMMADSEKRTASYIAKHALRSAQHTVTAKLAARHGDGSSCTYHQRLAREEGAIPDQRLTDLEVGGVGAGGELMLNMRMPPGDWQAWQLRDTVKDANLITATAQLDRLRLSGDAGLDIAIDTAETIEPQNSIEKLLAHQMAAAHVHAMRQLAKVEDCRDPVDQARHVNAAARLMAAFQDGAATLARLRHGGRQQVTVIHQHVQVTGGRVAVAGAVESSIPTNGKGSHTG
jgi:hypothetical protein